MVSDQEMSAAVGGTAYGSDGGKLGMIEAFFADDRTGAPTWVSVSTGLFGTKHSVVPVADATFTDGALHIPVTADAVKSAPPMKGEHLDPADEEALRRHYGLTGAQPLAPAAYAGPADDGPKHAAPVEGAAPDAPAASAATRTRLVRYVVTEDVQITVPVRREEIRVEHVPVDAVDEPGESLVADAPADGLAGEIVLHTERPVVTVEVVPVERVRLRTELVEGQEAGGQVQREPIVVDQDAASRT